MGWELGLKVGGIGRGETFNYEMSLGQREHAVRRDRGISHRTLIGRQERVIIEA
jgi:hypothetical protein